MGDSGSEPILVCMPCTDIDGPARVPGCREGICTLCGRAVWFDPNSVDTATRLYGQEPALQCVRCAVDKPRVLPPEQVYDMLAMGFTPQNLACTAAIAEIADGETSPETVIATLIEALRDGPDSPLVQRFYMALERTTKAVDEAIALREHRN